MLCKTAISQRWSFAMIKHNAKPLATSFLPVASTAVRLASNFAQSGNPEEGARPLTSAQRERTFIALKPDCVQRGLVGEVTKRLEQKGFKLCALKILKPSKGLAEKHYKDHRDKEFFQRTCRFLCSGPVIAMVWEGLNVIRMSRKIIGVTNPVDCEIGTIRGDFSSHFRRNLIHGSDSLEAAQYETQLWFDEDEIITWDHSQSHWMLELQNAPISFLDNEKDECHPGHLCGEVGVVNPDLTFHKS